MTRTRRIIHHASWFTLLGPFIGMLLTLIGLMCITSDSAMRLLADMNVQVNREILLNENIELIYRTILDYLFSIFKFLTQLSAFTLNKSNVIQT